MNRLLPWGGRTLAWRSGRRFRGGTRRAAPQGVRASAARSPAAPPVRLSFYKNSQSKCSVTYKNGLVTPASCCTEFQLQLYISQTGVSNECEEINITKTLILRFLFFYFFLKLFSYSFRQHTATISAFPISFFMCETCTCGYIY